MKKLLEDIRIKSGINQIEAEQALGVILGLLSAGLPSPIMGRIGGALSQNGLSKELGNASKQSQYKAQCGGKRTEERYD